MHQPLSTLFTPTHKKMPKYSDFFCKWYRKEGFCLFVLQHLICPNINILVYFIKEFDFPVIAFRLRSVFIDKPKIRSWSPYKDCCAIQYLISRCTVSVQVCSVQCTGVSNRSNRSTIINLFSPEGGLWIEKHFHLLSFKYHIMVIFFIINLNIIGPFYLGQIQ